MPTTTYEREVIELHQFFEEWLAGPHPLSLTAFSRVERVIGEDFTLINPDGTTTTGTALLDELRTANGSRPGWRMWVHDIRLVTQTDQITVVTYEEWHERDGETRGRAATAVLAHDDTAPNGFRWRHVQETFLPPSAD